MTNGTDLFYHRGLNASQNGGRLGKLEPTEPELSGTADRNNNRQRPSGLLSGKRRRQQDWRGNWWPPGKGLYRWRGLNARDA